MAGLAGFEPAHDGVKVRCLTAWLIPNVSLEKWGDRWDLNPRMLEPQTSALTPSPRPPYEICLAGAAGIEPTPKVLETFVLPLNYAPMKMVEADGFEPPNSSENRFTVCCVWPLR